MAVISAANMVTLLFNRESQYLGELVTREGALRHLVLTQAGEEAIGGYASQWQTRGVPVYKGISKHTDNGSREFVAYREYVTARHADFLHAIRSWMQTHEIQPHDVEDAYLPLWEKMLRLPLEPSERFQFLLALERSPASRLPAWIKLLDAAEQAAQVERTKTQQALVKLKTAVSKHLLDAFSRNEILQNV